MIDVRDDFPLLSSAREQGDGLVYLDSAATTQKPDCVLDAMDGFYRERNANAHRSSYRLAAEATGAYEHARGKVARFIGADADEVVFTSGATSALNLVAFCFGAESLGPGDEIVLSLLEHHSNLLPWQLVARQTGAKLVYLVPDRQGRLSDAEIDRVVGPRTRLVAIAHASNVLGIVAPIVRIVDAAHACGAVVVLDAAQSVAHLPLDVRALDLDFAAFSAHKMYGPFGIGALYGKRALLAALPPLMRGGGMVDTAFEQGATFAKVPDRFEAGTQNPPAAAGFAAAVEYLDGIGFEALMRHEAALTRQLVEGLATLSCVRLFGLGSVAVQKGSLDRCGIASFNVRGVSAADAARALDARGIAVRAGAHCAQPLMRHLGTPATCRASIGVYTTEQDIDRFLEAVESVKRDVVLHDSGRR